MTTDDKTQQVAQLEAELSLARSDARRWKDASDANREHAMANEDERRRLQRELAAAQARINEVECAAYEQGLDRAHQGEQEVSLPEEGLDGAPDDWYEKPFCRLVWREDSGDRSVGIQPSAGWVLSANQAGTVYEGLLAQAEARVQAETRMVQIAEAHIRGMEEQANRVKQVAVAAALDMAARHYPTVIRGGHGGRIIKCVCGWEDERNNFQGWPEHIRSLTRTDELSQMKVQAQLEGQIQEHDNFCPQCSNVHPAATQARREMAWCERRRELQQAMEKEEL